MFSLLWSLVAWFSQLPTKISISHPLLLLVVAEGFVLWCAKHKPLGALLGFAVPRRVGDLGLISLIYHLSAVC